MGLKCGARTPAFRPKIERAILIVGRCNGWRADCCANWRARLSASDFRIRHADVVILVARHLQRPRWSIAERDRHEARPDVSRQRTTGYAGRCCEIVVADHTPPTMPGVKPMNHASR